MRFEEKRRRLLKEFKAKRKDGIVLGKSTSNLFRYRKTKASRLDVKDFNEVISIDRKNLVAEVEGMTTYEKLVDATLKCGLMPPVVPQLKSITIGGAFTGLGIESSSFRFGLVHETVTEIEVLLADGKTVVCTPDNEHKDLFFGFPNSYGTLGYVLRLKVKLVPVKRYVRIEHTRFSDAGEFFKNLAGSCKKDIDFIDGTVFGPSEMYLTEGKFVDSAPNISDYTYMSIYYRSIQKRKRDYLKVKDYIWRWDTDWFWCSKHFGVQNRLIRLVAGRRFLNSVTYWKIRKWNAKLFGNGNGKESVIQDVEIPIENCSEFMDFFHREIGIKPVWVCPTKRLDPRAVFPLYKMGPGLYVNFGFWDVVKTDKEDGFYNKKIERKVQDLKGKKSLYSTSFYTEKEFWRLYNGTGYRKLKKRYDPEGVFKNLYEKCVRRQ